MESEEATVSSSWSREQDKAFENAIADYPEGCIDRWERIAAAVHGKTVEEIKHHYRILEEDIAAIMAGLVPLPNYASESEVSKDGNSPGAVSKPNQQQRNRGVPWTEEEHRNFLRGLDEFGKGDWRSISRQHVKSRTPTQVASHAQKFFDRIENPAKRERRRTSIHDITTVGSGDRSADQGPIPGQIVKPTWQSSPSGFGIANHMHGITTVGSRDPSADQGPKLRPTRQSPHLPAGPSGFGIANHIPTIGTPVPIAHHMLYGVQHPVPGAPINMGSMAYQMPDLWLEDNWC